MEFLTKLSICGFLGLLGQKNSLDVGKDTNLGNGHFGQHFVQFFVITDGQLQVTGDDYGLFFLYWLWNISWRLKNLSSQIFHDSCQVDRSTSTNSMGIVAFAEKTMDTTDGELKSGTDERVLLFPLTLHPLPHPDMMIVVINRQ